MTGDVTIETFEHEGHVGPLAARTWTPPRPTYVVVLAHGYGEHVGRYDHVARRLADDGAVVWGHDHLGHGRSGGERVLIPDLEPVVDDLDRLVTRARETHPGLPVVLLGHSMGGLIAARYAQRYADRLACVVLSGPVLGRWATVDQLLTLDEIPDAPIDTATLSRDPEVGRAYAADDLVWHGPVRRPTLVALSAGIDAVGAGGRLTVPTLWLHGEDDRLVPREDSRRGWEAIRGADAQEKGYPGARHEILNETNKDDVLDDVLAFVHAHLDV